MARRQTKTDSSKAAGRCTRSDVWLRPSPPHLVVVYGHLEEALSEVHEGKLDPRIAQAMSSLASAMVKVLTSGELEMRVRALEERQFANGGGRHGG
jgi:hypothetical protein